jgi:hypothetical protein
MKSNSLYFLLCLFVMYTGCMTISSDFTSELAPGKISLLSIQAPRELIDYSESFSDEMHIYTFLL